MVNLVSAVQEFFQIGVLMSSPANVLHFTRGAVNHLVFTCSLSVSFSLSGSEISRMLNLPNSFLLIHVINFFNWITGLLTEEIGEAPLIVSKICAFVSAGSSLFSFFPDPNQTRENMHLARGRKIGPLTSRH